jgi:Ca2+-dependent lipid-binding protein
MPCRLRVKIYEARDLPVMDRKTNLTDAYVEVQFDEKSEKTDVVRHSLNPVWNKAFRFDVTDDKSLQDSPLEILVWDYDLVGNDISIGAVYVDMNPLLNADSTRSISGWFPIFDTLQGNFTPLNHLVIKLKFLLHRNSR